MTGHRKISLAAAVLLLAGSTGVDAQNVITRYGQQPQAYLGFSYVPVDVGTRGERRAAIAVIEVVEDSPAERAGLAVDDTVLSINDIRVSDEFVSSLSSSLVPGDRVRLRVRRAGRERDVTIEAARRPAGYGNIAITANPWSYAVSPDSLRGQLRVFLDSAMIALDTMRLPSFRVEATPGGVWMFTDTSRVRLLPDSAWTGRTLIFPRDSLFFRRDTTWNRTNWRGVYSLGGDSLFSLFTDSLHFRPNITLRLDSIMTGFRYNMADTLGGRIFGLRGDSLFTFQTLPGDMGIARFSMSAIAGAELTELNEGLGDYFGADEGVLVVRVPDRTPAARAGLQPGDVIVRVNGRDISTVADLRRMIGRSEQPARLEIIRRNSRRTIELRQ